MGTVRNYRKRYTLDVGEIEFVAKNPKDHTFAYVHAVREAAYRRARRWSGEAQRNMDRCVDLLDAAIRRWKIEIKDGKATYAGPALQRDRDSRIVGERGKLK